MNSQTNPNTPPPATNAADQTVAAEETSFEKLRKSTVGFPSDAKISTWKAQAPGGRIRVFSPDGVRVFILRGLSGLELSSIHNNIPKNASNPDAEVQIASVAKCTLFTTSGQMTEEVLRTGPAGLPGSLFAIVQNLSDFYDPVELFNFSMEL